MEAGEIFLTVGAVLLLSLIADWLAHALKLPRISLLVLLGIAVGPAVLDLLPRRIDVWSQPLTQFALLLVAFLLGGELRLKRMRREGAGLLSYSISVVCVTSAMVALGLWLLGAPPILALLLGGVAAATDPAAVAAVIRDTGQDDRRTHLLRGIVAIDDAWGLIVFGAMLALTGWLAGTGDLGLLGFAVWELVGGLLVGLSVGLPAAYLTGLLWPGEPSRTEAIGVVLLAGGLAMVLGVSHLLAAMATGAVIANLAHHHTRPFREIEHFEWPFLVLFFIFAGAALDFDRLLAGGSIGLGYVVLRTAGRVIGGMAGAVVIGEGAAAGARVGASLTPQAGIALGMALVAAERHPAHAEALIAVTVAATVLFELVGPIATRWAITLPSGGKA